MRENGGLVLALPSADTDSKSFATLMGESDWKLSEAKMDNGYAMLEKLDFDHPVLGKVKIPGYPVTFSANRAGTVRQAPGLGEHTDMVMKDMCYDDKKIQALKKSHVIK